MKADDQRDLFLYKAKCAQEYAAIPVIAKINNEIDRFWENWPKQKIFAPEELLEFLRKLLGDALPKDDSAIKRIFSMPLPIKGQKQYERASTIYAPKEWSENDDLEFIYEDSVDFLNHNPSNLVIETKNSWIKFYKWLGVSWLPRIRRQFEKFEEDKWEATKWSNKRFIDSPHEKLPDWDSYCNAIYESYRNQPCTNPFSKSTVYLVSSFTLDKFDEIIKTPQKARRLLSLLATNWDSEYARYLECCIWWKEKKTYYKNPNFNPESYFQWSLKNMPWATASNSGWGLRKLSELFFEDDSLNKLGNMVPYIVSRDEKEKLLLQRLGVRDNITQLRPDDWWRIAIDLPRFVKSENKDFITPIYRLMLDAAEGLDSETPTKREFMASGKLLAAVGIDKYQYTNIDDVWYVKSEELRKLFYQEVPIFIIKNTEKKSAAIKKTFGIKDLEDNLESNIVMGEKDETYSITLSSFLTNAKHFLTARVFANRPSRSDADMSLMQRLTVVVVKSLDVSYILRIENKQITKSSDKKTFLDANKNTIFVDARPFNLKNLDTIRVDPELNDELGRQIASYLDVDLADAFCTLLMSDDEARYRKLSSSEISQEVVNEIRKSLQQTTQSPPVVIIDNSLPIPPKGAIGNAPPPVTTVQFHQPKLWTPEELGYGTPTEHEPDTKTGPPGRNPIGGKGAGPGYKSDKEERDDVALTGVAIVIGYEYHRHKELHHCTPKIENREKKNCGYDVFSECDKEVRQIEVKSSTTDIRVIELTAPEWDYARKAENGKHSFLYRIRYLDRESGHEPDIIEIEDPYTKLMAEATRFKVRLDDIKGKYKRIPLTKRSGS